MGYFTALLASYRPIRLVRLLKSFSKSRVWDKVTEGSRPNLILVVAEFPCKTV